MDDTTREIIDRITVKFDELTTIRSGHKCHVYYDCIQLSPSELARLAASAAGHLSEHAFDMVVGMANYGIFYAAALAGGKMVGILQKDGQFYGPSVKGKKVILADDVVASGSDMRKALKAIEAQGAEVVGFACIVDRSDGKADLSRPLWSAFQTNMA